MPTPEAIERAKSEGRTVVSLLEAMDNRVMADARKIARRRLGAIGRSFAEEVVAAIAATCGDSWDSCVTDFAVQAIEEEFQTMISEEIYRLVGAEA